ncbi:MAG: DUF4105 domain-containing protein [Poseidonibacter sp.]|uniref:Lnb N-terminal periplasmic domain-containing protein n=1 Tax=Poseidonibacter sp. TaxID=2321188 RepID=UPI00359DCE6D
MSPYNNPSPKQELISTINLLNSKHLAKIACNFPARYNYLKKNNYDIPNFNLNKCEELNLFIKSFNKKHVSIVFSSEYTNNPSSAFGHTMLLFSNDLDSIEIGDTVHFAAKTSKTDGFIKYSYKGFKGKYNGYFIREPFFKKIYEYNTLEQRHMYVYTLDFSENEILKLLYHLFEIRKATFKYYFLNGNCSTQITDLLNIVTNKKRTQTTYFLPIDTVKTFSSNVSSISKFTPLSNKLDYLIHKMSDYEKKIFNNVIFTNNKISADTPNIIKEALSYYTTFNFRRFHRIFKNYENIMTQKYTPTKIIDKTPNPLDRTKASYYGLGYYKNKNSNYLLLNYRPLFLDLQDIQLNNMQESEIKTLSLNLLLSNNSIKLKNLDFANIKSLPIQTSFHKPISWSIYSGLTRENKENDLKLNNEFGIGRTIDLYKNLNFSFLLNIGLENINPYVKPSIRFSKYLSNNVKVGASSYFKQYDKNEYFENQIFTSIKSNNILYTVNYINDKSVDKNKYLFSIKYNF